MLLFLTGIVLWTMVSLICVVLHVYSLCKNLKTTRIHCLLTLYCPIRIIHSLLEYLFWKELDKSGTETVILYNLAYILESFSLSVLIFIFQLVTAGYLIIEKKIRFCKIKKSLILICCLILSFL